MTKLIICASLSRCLANSDISNDKFIWKLDLGILHYLLIFNIYKNYDDLGAEKIISKHT